VAAAAGDESNDRVNRVERAPILCCVSRWDLSSAAPSARPWRLPPPPTGYDYLSLGKAG
jgi:hypothetical protein